MQSSDTEAANSANSDDEWQELYRISQFRRGSKRKQSLKMLEVGKAAVTTSTAVKFKGLVRIKFG